MELVYPAASWAAHLMFRALGLKIVVSGAALIPRTGPAVLASNHVSYLDFTLVGLAAQPRRVRFLPRHDAFGHWAAGPFLRAMRHVPVDRAAPAAAYLTSRRLLSEGEAVGIFPEAGVSRSYTVRSMMPGAAALARETGAPLVPVAIWGGQRIYTAAARTGTRFQLRRGRPITILVGEPTYVCPTADVVSETQALGARLQQLLERSQRIHPDQPRPGEVAPWHPAHLGGTAPTPYQARLFEDLPHHAIPLR